MHFSEDDLREALKRKDPGEGFTQRTMARVNQARVNQSASEQSPSRRNPKRRPTERFFPGGCIVRLGPWQS